MDGKRFVRSMSYAGGHAQIEYKNGIKVTLRQIEIEDPQESAEWSGTRSNGAYLHRFDPETLRGRCNKRFRPVRYANGYSLKTLAEVEGGTYAHLYRSEARRVGKECGSTCRSRWA